VGQRVRKIGLVDWAYALRLLLPREFGHAIFGDRTLQR